MTRRVGVCVGALLAGCVAHATPVQVPAAAPVASGPPRVLAGQLDGESPGCSERQRCERWTVRWADTGPKRIVVTADSPMGLSIDGYSIAIVNPTEQPSPTGDTLDVTITNHESFQIEVRGPRRSGAQAYQLAITPAPASVRTPQGDDADHPIDWSQRRAKLLAQRVTLAMRPSELADALGGLGKQYARVGQVPARLDGFAAVAVPVTAGRCYQLVVDLARGAQLSGLALRHLEARFMAPGGQVLGGEVEGSASRFIVRGGCARVSGGAQLELRIPEMKRGPFERELGQGAVTVAVWSRPEHDAGRTAAERDRKIREETRGFAAARTWTGSLEGFQPLALAVTRGKCYVFVLKLGPAAAFSDAVLKNGLGIDLDMPDLSVGAGPGAFGPGAIGNAGCPQASAAATLKLVPYGGDTLGQGSYTLTMYTRGVGAGELAKQAAEDRAERRESEASSRTRQAESCRECVSDYDNCMDRHGADCHADWMTCVRSKGYRDGDCGK